MNNIFYVISYFLIINFIGFFTMLYDKKLAIKNKFRVSEKSIFVLALLGGALGVYIGMYTFRHKTKHLKFTVLIPITIIINAFLYFFVITHIM